MIIDFHGLSLELDYEYHKGIKSPSKLEMPDDEPFIEITHIYPLFAFNTEIPIKSFSKEAREEIEGIIQDTLDFE